MSSLRDFEELEMWKKSRALTKHIYKITNEKPFYNDHGLKNQIRNSAVSVMSNIAEGFERDGNNEMNQFLYIAKGSIGELRSQAYVALDCGYINEAVFDSISKSSREIGRMIAGMIRYLKNSSIKGLKYKNRL